MLDVTLKWHTSLLVEVNENANLGYSQDQGTSTFQGYGFFRAILLWLILTEFY